MVGCVSSFMRININGAMMTDLVYWDMPYGMALAEWDVLLSEMDVEILFQQLAVINRARAHCLILGCIWHDMGRIRLAMLANGYTDVHVLVVYKPQQNTSGMEWINALEHLATRAASKRVGSPSQTSTRYFGTTSCSRTSWGPSSASLGRRLWSTKRRKTPMSPVPLAA